MQGTEATLIGKFRKHPGRSQETARQQREGLGFRIWGLGCKVLGSRVWGLRFLNVAGLLSDCVCAVS